jgi:hypothetical protein
MAYHGKVQCKNLIEIKASYVEKAKREIEEKIVMLCEQ